MAMPATRAVGKGRRKLAGFTCCQVDWRWDWDVHDVQLEPTEPDDW